MEIGASVTVSFFEHVLEAVAVLFNASRDPVVKARSVASALVQVRTTVGESS
jgi:hypothetical protein